MVEIPARLEEKCGKAGLEDLKEQLPAEAVVLAPLKAPERVRHERHLQVSRVGAVL